MSNFFEGVCPLCSRVLPRDRLCSHIAAEHERVREKTIRIIRAYHEDWSVDEGACEPCWKSFREAGQILNLLRQTKPKRPGYGWRRPEASGEEAGEEVGAVKRPRWS